MIMIPENKLFRMEKNHWLGHIATNWIKGQT